MAGTVLILGANGKAGSHSARAFAAAGWTVRRYDRHRDELATSAEGVDVIVNALNPPNYHDWAGQIPRITESVIAAARASGATVLIPGNVYHFGDHAGVWSAETPAQPVSRKGALRLAMERRYRDSGVPTIVLRAGNFIDPDKRDCVMSLFYLRDIARGYLGLPGPPEVRQAMCYLPDWARAAVALAERRETLDRFADIPFPGHTLSAASLKSRLERLLGRTLRYRRFPWWLMTLASPVWELARELREMRYLWRTDHALDGAAFDALLPGFHPTPLDDVLLAALPEDFPRPESGEVR